MSHRLIGHQPARIVLLETSSPKFTPHSCSCVCDALENVLCIGANMAGPSRIPLFGIYLLTAYPEVILPLSCTKGNFVGLHTAICDIRTFSEDSLSHLHSSSVSPCLAEAVAEACAQFRRYTNNLTQAPANCSQIELIILTGHSTNFVQNQLRCLPKNFDLSAIKRIVAASVAVPMMEDPSLTGTSDSPCCDMECDGFSGMVDTVTLDSEPSSLQRFFYGWLTETSSESEHLHLILPPPCPADPDLVIKCDIAEQLICPYQLPLWETFSLHTESNVCKYVYPPPSKTLGITVALQKLKVTAVVSRQAVCESVLFGLPLVVLPTTCWKMDWEVLETNQEHFFTLCSDLHQKDQVLLTQAVNLPDSSQQKHSKTSTVPKPCGYFVLMPSDKCLLIKSITPQELLLPMSPLISPGAAKTESTLRVQASLSQVKTLPDLNPLSLRCGLMPALRQMSLPKSPVDKARAVKRNATGSAKSSKAPTRQREIESFLVPQRPPPPVPGGRLTANHWSSPLAQVNNAKRSHSPATQI